MEWKSSKNDIIGSGVYYGIINFNTQNSKLIKIAIIMNKLKKILIILFIIFDFLKLDILSPDISFLDLPVSGKAASLGNTYLSDISNPSNLLLNPSNIWFGDKVNSSPNTLC